MVIFRYWYYAGIPRYPWVLTIFYYAYLLRVWRISSCMLYGSYYNQLSGFPEPLTGEGIDVQRMTAIMATMLLAAIIVPIVHKTSFKKATGLKRVTNPFIFKQLLFFCEYIFGGSPSCSS